jgi:hypothetical protein
MGAVVPLSSDSSTSDHDHSIGGFAPPKVHPQSALFGCLGGGLRMLKWHPGTMAVLVVLALILVALLAGWADFDSNFNW